MILGLGLDLCDVARIERAVSKPRFLERVYSEAERAQIAAKGVQTAAGYFAAKEAAAKALGTGFRGFMIWDIEVLTDEMGKPRLRLMRGALERMNNMGGTRIWVSITHLPDYAAAVCVVEGGERGTFVC